MISVTLARGIEPNTAEIEFFEKKIRPLLSERCYKCHSTRSEKLKGGLMLDSRESLLKGGDDGPVVQPGLPGKSKLIEAINYQNPDLQMPPKGKLADDQIADLTEWVKLGVPWPKEEPPKPAAGAPVFDFEKRRREHWAWQPIRKSKLPVTKDPTWPRNEVDSFVLAGLEQHQLLPAPRADRRTLLRRLYFDLIGLPPTPAEIDAFLSDKTDSAFEKVVDRLLASSHFGERWARHWLDLVRYAETLGHEFDYPLQNAWRYRDYVIRALNSDVPYDQFVMEHVAGDLLARPRLNPSEGFDESVIGTAFFWFGQREHSPVDVRQHQAELIDNQIDVMSKTFLALTVSCARCHDHKFDAISTKDFYALYGVLEGSRYAQKSIDPPALPKIERLRTLKKEIRRTAVAEWSKQAPQISKYLLAAESVGAGGTNAVAAGLDPERLARWHDALEEKEVSDPAHPFYPWITLARKVPKPGQSFLERWENLSAQTKGIRVAAETNQQVYATASERGFEGWFVDGDAFVLGAGGMGDFIVGDTNTPVRILSEPAVNDSVISRRLEGSMRSPGFKIERRYAHIYVAGRDARVRICVDNLTTIRDPIYGGLMKDLQNEQPKWLNFDLEMWRGHRAYIEFCDIVTPDPADESKREGGWGPLGYISASRVVFSDEAKPPRAGQPPPSLLGPSPASSLEALAQKYQETTERALKRWRSDQSAGWSDQAGELGLLNWLIQRRLLGDPGSLVGLVQKYQDLEASLPQTARVPAMADGDGVDERVFVRGNHKTAGELAPRQFLAALADGNVKPFMRGSGRLELAQCLTAPSDPLLARVMVNRVWLHLFGRGIVPTPDDFGALGQPPTHPELLDWLAEWYRTKTGWSTKRLIRLLVTSNTYRMSSAPADADAEEKDPDNSWLHRMPLKRLEGEAIRDAMLAVSGRLDEKMFGPPVRVHLTEFMQGRGRPSSSGPMDGDGRRSVYLEVRRNFISPMMRAFDAPVPFTTIGRRTVSNVPAQSLILLNDPLIAQQAHAWARRILADPKATPEQRVEEIYLAAFARPPGAEERTKALAFLQKQGVAYGITPAQCWQNEKVWADLCHVVFNLKEFIFVE
jgi:hypothetical protein